MIIDTGKFRCLDASDPQWDILVRSCRSWHPYYLSGFVQAEAQFHRARARLLCYEAQEGVAVYPVIEKPFHSDLGTTFDLRGQLYAGPITDADNLELHQTLVTVLRQAMVVNASTYGWVTDFCRLNPFAFESTPWPGSETASSEHVYVDLTLGYKKIWNEGYKKPCRRRIKASRKEGLTFETFDDDKNLSDFATLYSESMERANAHPRYRYTKAYFQSLQKHLKGSVCFGSVAYNGKMIGGDVLLFGNDYTFAFVGAVMSEYRELSPNNGRYDYIIQDSCKRGDKTYVLGGGISGNDGVFKFKQGFSSNTIQAELTKTILAPMRYEELCDATVGKHNRADYFPAYIKS